MATIPNLSADTRKSIEDRIQSATQLDSNYETAVKAGNLKPFVPEYIGSYGSNFENDAVKNRANKTLLGRISDLQALEKAQYPLKTFQKRLGAHGQGIGVYKFDLARKDALEKIKAEREAQRAALMGSVLGLVGTVVGAYFGGPVGAAGGGAAGQKAGQDFAKG